MSRIAIVVQGHNRKATHSAEAIAERLSDIRFEAENVLVGRRRDTSARSLSEYDGFVLCGQLDYDGYPRDLLAWIRPHVDILNRVPTAVVGVRSDFDDEPGCPDLRRITGLQSPLIATMPLVVKEPQVVRAFRNALNKMVIPLDEDLNELPLGPSGWESEYAAFCGQYAKLIAGFDPVRYAREQRAWSIIRQISGQL